MKTCSDCRHPDGGACQFAGEITDNFTCKNWEEIYSCTMCRKLITEAECSVCYTCPMCNYCATHMYTEGD
jgi:hypothetical protein